MDYNDNQLVMASYLPDSVKNWKSKPKSYTKSNTNSPKKVIHTLSSKSKSKSRSKSKSSKRYVVRN